MSNAAIRNGVNREEIESMLRAAVLRISGLPDRCVYFSEYASDTAEGPRPRAVITLLPDPSVFTHRQSTYVKSLEYWRVQVVSSADGIYSLSIDGNIYTYSATGKTMTEIRDGLVAAIGISGHPNFTAVAAGTVCIDIESRTAGYRLACLASASGLSLTQYRYSSLKQATQQVALDLQIECSGLYTEPIDVRLTGVDIAERLMMGLGDVDETADMRRAGHCIYAMRVTDARRIVDGEEETIGVIDAIIHTTAQHNMSIGHTTAAPFELTLGGP